MKKYTVLLSCIITSILGTSITSYSLGIWVIKTQDSTSIYAIISFLALAPQIFLAPFIGGFIDRFDKRKIIIAGQVFAGLGSLALMFIYQFYELFSWQIMIITFFNSIANGFIFQAYYVSTVSLVPKKKLSKAKALEMTGLSIISLVAPIASPFLFSEVGLNGIFLIDVVSFSISIMVFLFTSLGNQTEAAQKLDFRSDARLVINFLKSYKGLTLSIGYFFAINYAIGTVSIMFVPLIMDFADEITLSALMSLVGVGMFIGAATMRVWRGFDRPITSLVYLSMIIWLLMIGVTLSVDPVLLGIGTTLGMSVFAIITITWQTFWQTIVPKDLHARVYGYRMLIVNSAIPISYIISGLLTDLVTLPFLDHISFENKYYPGTNKTIAIILLYTFIAIINIVLSSFLILNINIKRIDKLYLRIREFNQN